MKKMKWLAILLAMTMVAAACGGDSADGDTASGDDSAEDAGDSGDTEDVAVAQGGDLEFHVITHGDSCLLYTSDAADE